MNTRIPHFLDDTTSPGQLPQPGHNVAGAHQPDPLLQAMLGMGGERRWLPASTAATAPAGKPEPAAHPLRVLVADDNPANRLVARKLLERRGHVVELAGDGREAFERWHAGRFDVILMDVQMPEMDGPAATQLIRARETLLGGHVPIIAMTAHVMPGTAEECLAGGMDAYVSKPLRPTEFVTTVERIVAEASPKAGQHGAEVTGTKASGPVDNVARTHPLEIALFPTPDGMGRVKPKPLVRWERFRELAGDNPLDQRQLLQICLETMAQKLPVLLRGLAERDYPEVKRTAHFLRGSLGLLELNFLAVLGKEIETQFESLGETTWRRCVERFCELLGRVLVELEQLQAG